MKKETKFDFFYIYYIFDIKNFLNIRDLLRQSLYLQVSEIYFFRTSPEIPLLISFKSLIFLFFSDKILHN